MTTPDSQCPSCVTSECVQHAVPCDACGDFIWTGPQRQHAVTIALDENAEPDTLLVHAGCAGTPLLRCLYSTWDALGGPEEGGWAFQCGALEAAVPAQLTFTSPTTAQVTPAADALLDLAFAALPNRRVFSFGLPALSFPEKRPHYE